MRTCPADRRLTCRVAFSLVAGAITTVSVAWYLARDPLNAVYTVENPEAPASAWPVRVPSDWPPPSFYFSEGKAGMFRHVWGSSGWPWHYVVRVEAGLPAKSMKLTEWAWKEGFVVRSDGWEPPDWAELSADSFPLRPIWPGFALDTALYGTLAFLLWSAPGFARRTRRRRRGLCAHCGYELKGMQKCPECGL